jgi:hypothetical protein
VFSEKEPWNKLHGLSRAVEFACLGSSSSGPPKLYACDSLPIPWPLGELFEHQSLFQKFCAATHDINPA